HHASICHFLGKLFNGSVASLRSTPDKPALPYKWFWVDSTALVQLDCGAPGMARGQNFHNNAVPPTSAMTPATKSPQRKASVSSGSVDGGPKRPQRYMPARSPPNANRHAIIKENRIAVAARNRLVC